MPKQVILIGRLEEARTRAIAPVDGWRYEQRLLLRWTGGSIFGRQGIFGRGRQETRIGILVEIHWRKPGQVLLLRYTEGSPDRD